MVGKAQLPRTSVDRTVKNSTERKKQFGRERGSYTGVPQGLSSTSGIGASSASGVGLSISGLATSGGTMIGPIAFFAKEDSIDSSGELDISKATGTGFSSRVEVKAYTGTSDDLVHISGAAHAGQILFLQAESSDTITLKHLSGLTGNIYMPSGSDYVVDPKEIVLLQWDTKNDAYLTSGGQWTLVATSTGSGGSSWVGTATSDLDMATYDIVDLCRIEFDQGGDTIDDSVAGIDSSSDKIRFNVPSGDHFHFTVDGDDEVKIDGTDFGIWGYLKFNSHTSGTNQVLPSESDGYISIKIGSSIRKLYFYT